MSTRHLVDPELAPMLDVFPQLDLSDQSIASIRAMMGLRKPDQPVPAIEPLLRTVPGKEGSPGVPVIIFDPPERTSNAAILQIHGGGMVMGSAASSTLANASLAVRLGLLVVAVDYRLAPEHPFPAPQEDCMAAYDWLCAEADSLGVDPARIAVLGESAGGGLAAALCLMVRDIGRPVPALLALTYPMLDWRTGSAVQPGYPVTGEFVWTRAANQYGWNAHRGDFGCDDERKGWFSPALADEVTSLPPTFMVTGGLDLFLQEDLDFAERLGAAGVPIEFHVYPGAFHAFNLVPTAGVTQQFNRDLENALKRALRC